MSTMRVVRGGWRARAAIALAVSLVGATVVTAGTDAEREAPVVGRSQATATARIDRSFGSLPVCFEPNVGQSEPGVDFVARGAAARLTATGALLDGGAEPVALSFVGATSSARVAGGDELPGKANYLRGTDPSLWHTNVPTYGSVRYEQLYPGVDLVWYGSGDSLEYDLVVAPGADAGVIAFELDGAPAPEIAGDGALVAGDLRLERPVAYQEIDGARRTVASRYAIRGDLVAIELGDYDRMVPLVVDPEIGYTYTFADASKSITIFGIAADSTGAAYVAGRARSTGQGGVLTVEVFVAKLNPGGTALVYSTTLGGSAGSDEARDVAVDASGNAYVTGFAFSNNFPTTAGAFQTTKGSPNGTQDAFVTKLGPGGDTLVYSSFLGGSSGTTANAIAVDASNSAYVTGFTMSSNFPTTTPSQGTFGGVRDAFVAKVNAAGSAKAYSTFLGGSQSDTGNGVAVDAEGNAYVAGVTSSTNFPVTAGVVQAASGGGSEAFWAKYDAAGQRTASTYLGGTGFDSAAAVAVDVEGNSYLTGETDSSGFPLVSPVQATIAGDRDAFVAGLNATGTGLVLSTFYGGSQYDFGAGVALDGAGSVFVTGTSSSSDFPTVDPVQPAYGGGASDAFVIQLIAGGGGASAERGGPLPLFASLIGGTGRDQSSGGAFVNQTGLFVGLDFLAESGSGLFDESGIVLVETDFVAMPDLGIYSVGAFIRRSSLISFEADIQVIIESTDDCDGAQAPSATFEIYIPPRFNIILAEEIGRDVEVVGPPLGQNGVVKFQCNRPVPAFSQDGYIDGEVVGATVTISYSDVLLAPEHIDVSCETPVPECEESNNSRTYRLEVPPGVRGSLDLYIEPTSEDDVKLPNEAPRVRLIGNSPPGLVPVTGSARRGSSGSGYRVYASTQPNVQPTAANFFTAVPPGQTSVDVSTAPSGSFFVVTATTGTGESPPSNEVGGRLPTVTKLKVSASKIVAQGTGFSSDVQVFFGGLPFGVSPKLKRNNTKVVQKGAFITGESLGSILNERLGQGETVSVVLINGNGNGVAVAYTKP